MKNFGGMLKRLAHNKDGLMLHSLTRQDECTIICGFENLHSSYDWEDLPECKNDNENENKETSTNNNNNNNNNDNNDNNSNNDDDDDNNNSTNVGTSGKDESEKKDKEDVERKVEEVEEVKVIRKDRNDKEEYFIFNKENFDYDDSSSDFYGGIPIKTFVIDTCASTVIRIVDTFAHVRIRMLYNIFSLF